MKWNIESLFDHFNAVLAERQLQQTQRFEAQEKAVESALIAVEKAVLKAEAANQARFESVNEFRAQLSDQTASFVTRNEFNAAIANIAEKIENLKTYKDTTSGKSAGSAALWAIIVGGVSFVGAIIVMVTNILK